MTRQPGVDRLPTPGGYVEDPDKLIRIATVAKAMLEEARSAPCDAAGCEQMRIIYERTLTELDGLLSADLRGELSSLVVTFADPTPSPSEVRVAQAELVGWLEGLFGGIVAAAEAQRQGAAANVDAPVGAADAGHPGQYL